MLPGEVSRRPIAVRLTRFLPALTLGMIPPIVPVLWASLMFPMRLSSKYSVRFFVPLMAVALAAAPLTRAQKQAKQPEAQLPPAPKAPALIDPAGPSFTLQTSEALFDIAVALNACGYDNGLADSNPVRAHVRQQVNQATQQSAQARNDRDQLCLFVDQHHLAAAS